MEAVSEVPRLGEEKVGGIAERSLLAVSLVFIQCYSILTPQERTFGAKDHSGTGLPLHKVGSSSPKVRMN